MAYRVAIIGDSAMWGQGLLRQNTYAFKVATALAAQTGSALEIVPGRGSATMEPERGEARSGAQLHVPVVSAPYRDRENPENIRRDLVRYAGQSAEFPQTFPAFFDTVSSKNAFVRGEDHTPARLLSGSATSPSR